MKNILDQIVATKHEEVSRLREATPVEQLKNNTFFNRPTISLQERLTRSGSSGIIAEFKKQSPSKGNINISANVEEVTRGYAGAGAAGLSVLTDFSYFGGSVIDLVKAREANPGIPILRKDFMIDPYQIIEARAYGADVILLIAASLSKEQVHDLAAVAREYDLEVLLEVHDAGELEKISPLVNLVGVNNRNLKSFVVDTNTSIALAGLIPDEFVKISESGISHPETIGQLRQHGFEGFLIGENFMKTDNPAQSCRNFIDALKK